MKAVWPDTFVEEGNLTQTIFVLRKALGDADGQSFIITIPRQGYRFAGAVTNVTPTQPVRSPIAGPHRVLPWAIAGSLALLAAGVSWLAWRTSRPASSSPLLHLSVDLGPDAVEAVYSTVAISPDGSRILFPIRAAGGKQMLAMRLLDQLTAQPLRGTEGGANPFFSPNGQWIGYFSDRKLKKISILGGEPITLCDIPDSRQGGSWGGDDTIIMGQADAGLSRVSAAGGAFQPLTKPADRKEATHRWPQILPGREAVIFTANATSTNFDEANIDVLQWKTGQRKTIQRGGYYGRYVPTGHLVWMRDGTLFAARFDPVRLELTSAPVPVLQDVAANANGGSGQFDFSRNGVFVYLAGKPLQWPIVWMDSAGKTQPLIAAAAHYRDPSLSPDGKKLAVAVGLGHADIWIYDLQRESFSRRTFTKETSRYPVWTSDGKHFAFASIAPGGGSIWWMRADGSGQPELLWQGTDNLYPHSFSPDGRRLLFSQKQKVETDPANWILPLDTSDPERPKPGKPTLFGDQTAGPFSAAFSHDGRWVDYSSTESTGNFEIYVRSLDPGRPGKWQISSGQGVFPVWSRNGPQLLYQTRLSLNAGRQIMAVDYEANGDSFSAGRPRLWVDKPLNGVLNGRIFDLAPDGTHVVVFPDEAGRGPASLHVSFLVNFFDELQRRLPEGRR